MLRLKHPVFAYLSALMLVRTRIFLLATKFYGMQQQVCEGGKGMQDCQLPRKEMSSAEA